MFTKQHYKQISTILAEERPERLEGDKWSNGARDEWETICLRFARMLEADNPRFSKETFLAVCKEG